MLPRLILLLVAALSLLSGCAPVAITGGATAVAVVHDRRSVGTLLEDKEIGLKISNYIQKQPELKKFSDVASTSFNRRVLLTGAVASPALSRQIANYAKGLNGVREVINEIEIHPEYDGGIQGTLNDSYISTQAKLRLFNVKLPTFDPTRVEVTTYNGSIHLMGMVSRTEGSAAAEEVRYVQGVSRVVKHFEYIKLPAPSSRQASPGGGGSANLERFH
ncbi:MAG: BON domain-containing protein [Gammaproteobacteria bacterium SHHR-1]|uniref:BON domain-containing protein n=1 Tax=Magnetovirga frankeli TaxID=947516 RepID=UPI001293FCA4|nr:BON domain-containing protein [gamma proteobacterium SS-5]